MLKYCVVCTCELNSPADFFVDRNAICFFDELEDAITYGEDFCRDLCNYPAAAGFCIYRLLSLYD